MDIELSTAIHNYIECVNNNGTNKQELAERLSELVFKWLNEWDTNLRQFVFNYKGVYYLFQIYEFVTPDGKDIYDFYFQNISVYEPA